MALLLQPFIPLGEAQIQQQHNLHFMIITFHFSCLLLVYYYHLYLLVNCFYHLGYTPSILNYKTFWLFYIHSFCNALRYTLCLDYIIKSIYLEKPKMSDNLEWREQIIVPMYGKFTYEIPVVMNLLSILFHLLSGNYQGICNCTFPR